MTTAKAAARPRAARACVYGAAMLCVEVGIEASKAVDAFREEYERAAKAFHGIDKFPERLTADVRYRGGGDDV